MMTIIIIIRTVEYIDYLLTFSGRNPSYKFHFIVAREDINYTKFVEFKPLEQENMIYKLCEEILTYN
jgi:hypothetical protein